MTRMPSLKSKEVISILEKAGFHTDHITGSHYIMRQVQSQRRITVPYHAKDIKRGVLRSITKQSGLSQEEFISLR